MDFNLSREHQLIRKMMAEFTEKEVKPIAAETDRTCEYPRENIEKLFDLGVMGMCVPKEYGGAGADPLASAICIEELSKQCASTGDIVATHNGLCCDPIMNYGTPEQQATGRPRLRTGAVSRNRPGRRGCSTTASFREHRPWATSEKSISARSERPRARSRFLSPTSQSRHNTRLPDKASAAPTPAVKDVFPVPPFPDTTAMHCPCRSIRPFLPKISVLLYHRILIRKGFRL